MPDDDLNVEVAVLDTVVKSISKALDKIDLRLTALERKLYGAIGSAIILGLLMGAYVLKVMIMKGG